MIRQIKRIDKTNFLDYCSRYGNKVFNDLSLDNLSKEFDKLQRLNNYCIVDEENSKFRGILIVEKKDKKCYIKTIYKNPKILDRLLNILIWNFNKDLILQLNDYKVVSVLKKYHFYLLNKENNIYTYFRKYYKKVKTNGGI